ncbi:MAG: polysaccharide biosynthesis tyrosine autokinase [Solobacterium sp.]|nr:polysaccharide biosynthesis tyrosine autokinase [Solobacterium sp.]
MSTNNTELEKLDITQFIDGFLHALKRTWIIVLILTLGFGAFRWFRVRSTYVPVYKAEATVAVYAVSESSGADSKSAEQLGTVFPYILTSGVLKDVIMADMGVTSLPGTIKVANIEGTNLLTISVSTSDPDTAYRELLSVIENYPKVAEYVVGSTRMEIVDDNGVPSDSGRTVAVRSNVLRGALMGLILGLLITAGYMVMFRTVRSAKDIRSLSNIECLGTLPVYRKKKRKNTASSINIMEHNVQEDYLESLRLIRTRVLRRLEENKHKVIMVTSSVPGEGKTTIAANLAISMSGKNKKVILIDCDLRNPSLQEIFRVPEDQPGIVDVLDRKVKLSEAIVNYAEYGMDLMVLFGSQKNHTAAPELLSGETMGTLINGLKQIADVIILDTPPSAMLVDAMLVSKYVDEALYVIMCDYAKKSVVVNGIQELSAAGVEIGGFILNGGKSGSGTYGYHSYGYNSRYYTEHRTTAETKKEAEKPEETIPAETTQESEQ